MNKMEFAEELKKRFDKFDSTISHVSVDDYFINLANDHWSFYSDSSWRIIKKNSILFSSDSFLEENKESIHLLFLNERISSITPLSFFKIHGTPADLCIKFSNNVELHTLAMTVDEPWVLTLPDIFYTPS